jgi:hypothetical protein
MSKDEKKDESRYAIQCTVEGKHSPDEAVAFKRAYYVNGKKMKFDSYYVPINKPVLVPYWVYRAWLDSEYNSGRTAPVDPDHIIKE